MSAKPEDNKPAPRPAPVERPLNENVKNRGGHEVIIANEKPINPSIRASDTVPPPAPPKKNG